MNTAPVYTGHARSALPTATYPSVAGLESAEGLVVVELEVEHIELSLAQANGRGSAGECPARHCAKTPAVQERVIRVAAGSGLASARATAHAAVGGGVV